MPPDEAPLHRVLKVQLRVLPFVIASFGVLLFTNLTLGHISLLRAAAGLLIGALLGTVLNRVQRISWSTRAKRVIATVDAAGVAMLALFLVLVSLRAVLALRFSSDLFEAAVVGMATGVGAMSVRLRGLRRRVRKAVETLDPPSPDPPPPPPYP